MKKNYKLFAILTVLCIFGGLNSQSVKYEKSQPEGKKANTFLSTTWVLTGVLIQIDNLDPSKTWSKVALDNAWCSGSGTWGDPYIIENVSINSQNLGNSIEIKNSNDFFIIKNNLLYNSTHIALYLSNTTNGRIIDNIVTGMFYRGIKLDYSNNNTMIGNLITTNGIGFELTNSQNNRIIQNSAVFNDWDGIFMQYSDNNTLFLNNFSSNGHYGLFLSASNYNNLSYNIANFNPENGIYLYAYYGTCDFNLLQKNDASFNQKSGINIAGIYNTLLMNTANLNFGNGIELSGYKQNSVQNNTCNYNTEAGIEIGGSSKNNITNNFLTGNRKWAINFFGASANNSLSKNLMEGSDIGFPYGELSYITTHSIDTSNLVNGKEVYYYVQKIGLTPSNFSDTGQTILINCSNGNITNSGGLGLYYSNNNLIYENDFSSLYYGIYLYKSNYNSISANNGSNNANGIMLYYANNNTVSDNYIQNSTEFGIYIMYSLNNTITGNILEGGGVGIEAINRFYSEVATHQFDLTNTVNGDVLYHYKDQENLGELNFSGAGQIILVNCSSAYISQIDASVTLYYSDYATISRVNISHYFNYGIYLYESDYANITSVIVNNSNLGIYLSKSRFTNISYSIISHSSGTGTWKPTKALNTGAGVLLLMADDNYIFNNSIMFNMEYGIRMEGSNRNWIYENLMVGNKEGGIYNYYGDNNIIEDNIIKNNIGEGIFIIGSNFNDHIGNSIVNNSLSGVYLQASDDNQFYENYFHTNTYGIYLQYSADNSLIYNNTFFENLIQDAYEDLLSAQWDNGLIGNSWTDYSGKDIDDNGIGDSAYYFDDSVDNYPLWWDAPMFEILDPYDSDVFGTISPAFSLNMTEGVASSVKYSFNNETTSYSGSVNGFINQDGWNLYGSGEINITFSVNDSRDVSAEAKQVSIIKDIESPNITIISPDPFQVFNSTPPQFILEIVDTHFYRLNYTVNSQTPDAHSLLLIDAGDDSYITYHSTLESEFWDSLPNGEIVIRFYASDIVGNEKFKEITIIKNVSETTETPPDNPTESIPGFLVIPVLGFICIVSILYYRSKKGTK